MSGKSSFPSFKSAPRPLKDEGAGQVAKYEEERLESTTGAPQEAAKANKPFFKDKAGDFDIAKYDFQLSKSQVPLHPPCHRRMTLGFPPRDRIDVLPTGGFILSPQATLGDIQPPKSRYFELLAGEPAKFGPLSGQTAVLTGDYVPLSCSDDEGKDLSRPVPSGIVKASADIVTDPHNVQKWIEFVDSAYFDARFPRQARRQRAIAISSAALKENSTNETLIMKFMDLQGEIQPSDVVLQMWQLILQKFPYTWSLRFSFLEHYSSKCFPIYSVRQGLKHHIDLLSDVLAAGEEGCTALGSIKCRIVDLLLSSGHVEEVMFSFYHGIWRNPGPVPGTQRADEFASYWNHKKAQYAGFSGVPLAGDFNSLLRAELQADFTSDSLELDPANLEPVFSRNGDEVVVKQILSGLGIVSMGGRLEMAHGCWIVSPDFSVSPSISLSEAPLLSLNQFVLLLNDLEASSSLAHAVVLAAQLLCVDHEIEKALRLLRSHMSQRQSDMALWHHYIMLMRMDGGHNDQTLGILDKLTSSPTFATSSHYDQSLLMCSYCETLCLGGRSHEAQSLLLKSLSIPSLAPSSLLKAQRALAANSDPLLAHRWSTLLGHMHGQSVNTTSTLAHNTPLPAATALCAIHDASSKEEAQVLLMSLLQSAPYSKGTSSHIPYTYMPISQLWPFAPALGCSKSHGST